MDRKIALKWARALESGEYKQTTGGLRDEDGFCCLGVLCNLHAQEHPDIAAKETDPTHYMGSAGVLPEHVMYWADIRSDAGTFSHPIEMKIRDTKAYASDTKTEWIRDMIELNDEHGYSFKQIAEVIRKYSDKL